MADIAWNLAFDDNRVSALFVSESSPYEWKLLATLGIDVNAPFPLFAVAAQGQLDAIAIITFIGVVIPVFPVFLFIRAGFTVVDIVVFIYPLQSHVWVLQ